MSRKIARLVVRGWPRVNAEQAEDCLYRSICNLSEPVDYLTTPGGFVFVVSDFIGGVKTGWDSRPEELAWFEILAEPTIRQTITPRVMEAARDKVRYLTLGFDIRGANVDSHAELVAVIHMATGVVLGITGKSYPTLDQEDTLVHVTDIESHCFDFPEDRILVLGCHDLNVFNNRARANQKPGGERYNRCTKMLEEFRRFKPTVILQHPHATDTWKTWIQSWRAIGREFPDADWASGIAYAHLTKTRESLADVLSKTNSEGDNGLSIIVNGARRPTEMQKDVVPAVPQLA